MENFIVTERGSSFGPDGLIEAKDIDEARRVYAKKYGIYDDGFLYQMYRNMLKLNFAERFLLTRSCRDEYDNMLTTFEEKERIDRNIDDYFAGNKRFSNIYKKHYWADTITFEEWKKNETFPEEMLIYIYIKAFFLKVDIQDLDCVPGL